MGEKIIAMGEHGKELDESMQIACRTRKKIALIIIRSVVKLGTDRHIDGGRS